MRSNPAEYDRPAPPSLSDVRITLAREPGENPNELTPTGDTPDSEVPYAALGNQAMILLRGLRSEAAPMQRDTPMHDLILAAAFVLLLLVPCLLTLRGRSEDRS